MERAMNNKTDLGQLAIDRQVLITRIAQLRKARAAMDSELTAAEQELWVMHLSIEQEKVRDGEWIGSY
jgi:hypothetical protein